jgi:hypothetical protein
LRTGLGSIPLPLRCLSLLSFRGEGFRPIEWDGLADASLDRADESVGVLFGVRDGHVLAVVLATH